MNENKTNINWYPGHMAKTKREIKEKIDLVDVVVMVIDARIPKSSYLIDINEYTKNKEKILVFSKYDLCDKEKTLLWKEKYEKEGFKVVLSSINDNKVKEEIIEKISLCMSKINEKRIKKGLLAKKAKVLIVGVSNVGKSTLINKLIGKKSAKVGNKPGITKSISMIKINDKIDLIDTPGVLWPNIENEEVALNLAAMTIIKEEILPLDKVAVHILKKLSEGYKSVLKEVFGIDCYNDEEIIEIYEKISRYKNIPFIDGEADYDKINLLIINSIKNETIKGITFD